MKITTPVLPGTPSVSDEYTPIVMSATAQDESLIAWKETSSRRIQVGALANDDKTFRKIYETAGDEVHALVGNDDGGAMVVMASDPDIYSSKYCQSDATPSNAICGKFDVHRFNNTGIKLFTSTLTDKTNVDSDGALFAWWYGHTARLTYDSVNNQYLTYFRSAGSSPRPNVPGEIDIHAGDTLRRIDGATGARLSGGWQWGCSHSWSVRLAVSGARSIAVCHGDGFPNAMSAKQLNANGTVINTKEWLGNSDPAKRALGGVVPTADGFWINYIDYANTLRLHLAKIDLNGNIVIDNIISAATNLDSDYPFRAYMAKRGNDLLLGWKSGGNLVLATASLTTGLLTSDSVATTSKIDNFNEFVSLNNGDVIWASVSNNNAVTVSRVGACR